MRLVGAFNCPDETNIMVGIISTREPESTFAWANSIKGDPYPMITGIIVKQPRILLTDTPKTLDWAIQIINWAESIGRKVSISININSAISTQTRKNATDILRLQDIPDCLKKYLDGIRKHLHKIEKIEMSWNGDYTSGAYKRWINKRSYASLLQDAMNGLILPAIEEFEKMASFVPDIIQAGKLSFQAVEAAFEREAFLFENRLDEAPLLSWLKQNKVSVCLGGGAWALDKHIYEHLLHYAIVKDARSPILVHRELYDAGEYPYEYYQQYLRAGHFESGIGYKRGIKRGNAKNLIDIGYKKSWFWDSVDNLEAWHQWVK